MEIWGTVREIEKITAKILAESYTAALRALFPMQSYVVFFFFANISSLINGRSLQYVHSRCSMDTG